MGEPARCNRGTGIVLLLMLLRVVRVLLMMLLRRRCLWKRSGLGLVALLGVVECVLLLLKVLRWWRRRCRGEGANARYELRPWRRR